MNHEIVERMDTAKQKRVELHLHTKLSDDISVITPEDAIDYASGWHHSAIAFTNLDSVQDFAEIWRYYNNCDNKDFEIIYGAEVFFENDDGKRGCRLTLLAKNQEGIKALYRVISSIEYDGVCDVASLEVIKQNRNNLLVGSCGNMGELFSDIRFEKTNEKIEKTALFYDYLEIFPTCDPKEIAVNKQIYALGEKLGIPVVAAGNCHYLFADDEICIDMVKNAKGLSHDNTSLWFRTTDEMLEEFSYLGVDSAYKAVVTNTNIIADLIEKDIEPLKYGCHFVSLDNAAKQVCEIAYKKAYEIYGNPLPAVVKSRLETELYFISCDEIATQYLMAHKMGLYANSLGCDLGIRGTTGSVLVNFLLGVGDVNPLRAHYYCPNCHYIDFNVNAADGYDLPDKNCPRCDKPLKSDGHNIPYQSFMGAYGSKLPDIDINLPVSICEEGRDFVKYLFDGHNVAWAGTVNTLTEYYADIYIKNYEEKKKIFFDTRQREAIKSKILNTKRGEGRHPAGIMVLPHGFEFEDFTPVRNSDTAVEKITHFDFHELYDTILKVDVLGICALEMIEL